jgi:hypothetical protein
MMVPKRDGVALVCLSALVVVLALSGCVAPTEKGRYESLVDCTETALKAFGDMLEKVLGLVKMYNTGDGTVPTGVSYDPEGMTFHFMLDTGGDPEPNANVSGALLPGGEVRDSTGSLIRGPTNLLDGLHTGETVQVPFSMTRAGAGAGQGTLAVVGLARPSTSVASVRVTIAQETFISTYANCIFNITSLGVHADISPYSQYHPYGSLEFTATEAGVNVLEGLLVLVTEPVRTDVSGTYEGDPVNFSVDMDFEV